jgi:hypothetical protein
VSVNIVTYCAERIARSAHRGPLERSPVGLRAGADEPLEAIPEGRRGVESDLKGEPLDRMPSGFEQVLRLADPGPV